MTGLLEHGINCPYCGEQITTLLDLSQGSNNTIEDCTVCCRPIEIRIETDGVELLGIQVSTDDGTLV